MKRILAFRDSSATDVEIGADGAPSAFRIWASGPNVTDHGTHIFNEESARRLMAEQAMRGNLYSIDCDHLSLNKESPPEARKAVGWHRLEVRNGDLWAVDVKWTDVARAGLVKDPPEWRYFSPAYDVNKNNVVTSYMNTALTNNPATWSVTALATKGNTMSKKYESIVADLMGGDDEKKAKAIAALAAAFPDDDGDGDKDGDKKETKAAEEEPEKKDTKAAEDDADKKDAKDIDVYREATKAATRELASTVTELQSEVDELKKDKEEKRRGEVLAARPDLPEKLVKTLRGMPLDLMTSTVESLPPPVKPDPASAAKVQATRGSNGAAPGGSFEIRAARLPQSEHEDLVSRMGGDPKPQSVHWDSSKANDLVFPQISKQQARRILAARAAKENS